MHAAPAVPPSHDHADTIAALATARGRAALAVVRLSGPEAVAVVASRFSNGALADAPSHTLHVGYLLDGDGQRLDEVVVALFRAPRSSTGEDVAEVTCHGGDVAPQLVLRSLLDAGARLAAPGEFTQRAFLNGKLDLAQAEAVADLIHAEAGLAHRAALGALQGHLSALVTALRERLIETAALVELELDFSDEDVAFADRAALDALLRDADRVLFDLLDSARLGALARDGVRVAIGGRPNAGKSTLLNALAERDRAIVSPEPGTTRDALEAEREIGGLRFRFVDTAGLRTTADAVEAEGVRRAHDAIASADALLYVYDATAGLDADEVAYLETLAAAQPALPILRVANKADLLSVATPTEHVQDRSESDYRDPQAHSRRSKAHFRNPKADSRNAKAHYRDLTAHSRRSLPAGAGRPFFLLSARAALTKPEHLDGLRSSLLATVAADLVGADASALVVNERHRQELEKAREAVRRAQDALAADRGGDVLALDLRAALHALGAITGAVTSDDVLGAVFSRFCIGK